jgi:uncharacterized protein (DUF362 family)
MSEVALTWGPLTYDATSPYSPGMNWPEYAGVCSKPGHEPNPVYTAVRESLSSLNLDSAHYGSPAWNPLGAHIRPGDTVVLKPNFVRDFRESSPDPADCLITHPSILRAVLDYAYIALAGKGRLIIADAPQNDADFDRIRRLADLDVLSAFYRDEVGFPLEIYDLRQEAARKIDGVIVGHTRLPGDPAGYVPINLGPHSAFTPIDHHASRLYGAEYDSGELHRHHGVGIHEYLISRTILSADCVISIPKLKTHKKTGLTVNMKNLVGINGNKNWLPHHREGTPSEGGDQYSSDGFRQRSERALLAAFKRCFPLLGPLRPIIAAPIKTLGKKVFGDTSTDTVRSGNWFGNDTTWRMVIDLNRILLYADRDGCLHDRPVRRFFSVVDGIVAGEGNGPLDPRPRPTGLVVAGGHPIAVDLVCARLMGFDYRNIPMLYRALEGHRFRLASFGFGDVLVRSNVLEFSQPLKEFRGPLLHFAPHFGWTGHIETQEAPDEVRSVS